MNKVKPVADSLSQLAAEKLYVAMSGNYKGFKTASKRYAKIAAGNLDLIKQARPPKNIPLFSKLGMRILKLMALNFFRKKTPDEKIVKEYFQRDKYISR